MRRVMALLTVICMAMLLCSCSKFSIGRKAAAADPSLADEASRMIAQYSKYYPQTAEAFMYNFTDGQSYTCNCSGLTATTTVRTQK